MALEKFTWQNGTQIEPAKVEIGGQRYNVSDAQYEGETPLSAANLNLMQDTLLANVKNDLTDDTKIPSVKAVKEVYSTVEKIVGKWIDGKPIYRKVLEFNNVPTGVTQKNHGISNFDKLINYSGYYYNSTWGYIPIPAVTSDNMAGYGIGVADFKSTTFYFNIGDLRSSTNEIKLIVDYTKTTD